MRRRQQGLLPTSAHRAKGLEFDHVVMLDGQPIRASTIKTVVCTMGEVFMDFAGRSSADDETHRAISALNPGDALSLTRQNARWKVLDRNRHEVGRMRADWDVPNRMEVVDATVYGVFVRWLKDVKDDRCARYLQANTWEVVIPKLTLSSPPINKHAH